MNDNDLLQAGRAIERAGAAVFLPLPGVGGSGPTIRVSAHDLGDLVRNPDAYIAKMLNVTAIQLQTWKVEGGVPRCAADTKFGPICKNSVSPHTSVEPRTFADLHRQAYCHVHGG